MNRCVACGAEIPEGSMVCKTCMDRTPVPGKELLMFPGRCNGKTLAQAGYVRLTIDDIRNEAIKEFSDELLKILDTEVMPRYEASNIDYTYRNGAKMCRLDVEIEIAKLLRKFKDKEKDNG